MEREYEHIEVSLGNTSLKATQITDLLRLLQEKLETLKRKQQAINYFYLGENSIKRDPNPKPLSPLDPVKTKAQQRSQGFLEHATDQLDYLTTTAEQLFTETNVLYYTIEEASEGAVAGEIKY